MHNQVGIQRTAQRVKKMLKIRILDKTNQEIQIPR